MLEHNYHTHTARCNHAEGTERDYIENAISAGFKTLGFSDHAPYVFENGYYSNFRMRPDDMENYTRTVLALREEFKGVIDIRLGYEAEYYPKFFPAFLRMISDFPVEYLILGQHALRNEMGDGLFCVRKTTDAGLLAEYADQVCEALETRRFSCIAHPDVFNYAEDDEHSRRAWLQICNCAKKAGVPLEINLLGLRSKRHYPNARFWEIAGEVGNEVIFGMDAHTPGDVADKASWNIGKLIVQKYGLNLIDRLTLINPAGGSVK